MPSEIVTLTQACKAELQKSPCSLMHSLMRSKRRHVEQRFLFLLVGTEEDVCGLDETYENFKCRRAGVRGLWDVPSRTPENIKVFPAEKANKIRLRIPGQILPEITSEILLFQLADIVRSCTRQWPALSFSCESMCSCRHCTDFMCETPWFALSFPE